MSSSPEGFQTASKGHPIAREDMSCFLLVVSICLLAIGLGLLVGKYYTSSADSVFYTGKLDGHLVGGAVLSDCRASPSHFILGMSERGELVPSYVNIALPTTALSTGNHLLSGNFGSDSEYGIVGIIIDDKQSCSLGADNFVSGSVTLRDMPDRSRQRIRGAFEAVFRCQGDKIELKGEFSFRTSDDFNADCLD